MMNSILYEFGDWYIMLTGIFMFTHYILYRREQSDHISKRGKKVLQGIEDFISKFYTVIVVFLFVISLYHAFYIGYTHPWMPENDIWWSFSMILICAIDYYYFQSTKRRLDQKK